MSDVRDTEDKALMPEGWDEARVRKVIMHYEKQTEDEAVTEDETVDLQDENTQPNPIIRKLIDIGNDLFGFSMDSSSNPTVAWQYNMAVNHIHGAISCLMEVKNTIAREQGEGQ